MRKEKKDRNKTITLTLPLLGLLIIVTIFLLVQFGLLINKAQKHNSDEIELTTLSHFILHDNNHLIKTLKIYILTQNEAYRVEYLNLLNNFDSFYGRVARMKEIGLSEREMEIVNKLLEIWNKLENFEKEAIETIDNGDANGALSIMYGEEYIDTDNSFAEYFIYLITAIKERSRVASAAMYDQVKLIMLLFSIAFAAILITLAVIVFKNNKLKDLYIKEQLIALEKEKQNNMYKSNFLATMSHEIRTPMNAILGVAEIQLRSENLSGEAEEGFGKIYESGNLLLHIINDILDFSKIEAGKLELIPVEYDIPSLINDTVQINRMRYENKPIEFILNIEENTPLELFGDELRIKQILNNILSNAFKYTDKGEICLSVSVEYPENNEEQVILIISIRDTGQGMSEDQVKRLFDDYSRFNLEANRTTIGTGLGMGIARKLVDLMNGKILVESTPGEGSTFTVQIPQRRIGIKVCGADLAAKLQNFSFKTTSLAKKAQVIREYMPYGSVLIVDDVESNIYVANGMLVPYGLHIESVTSGFDAIEKVKDGNVYDIIFMDHMMPKMDGIETTKKLRDMGYNKYIVALTANAIIGQAGMFLKNGFDGYISKPIDSRELNFILNDFIRDKKPPEVVAAARKDQKIKEIDKSISISEIKRIFVLDVEKAISALRYINGQLQNSKQINGNPSLSGDDMQFFIINVHGMKGSLSNIGEEVLAEFAFNLEKAANEGNFEFVIEKIPEFINELQLLTIKYKPEEKEIADVISKEDLIFLREKMLAIISACKIMNKKSAKDALHELKHKTWPRQIKHFMDDISLFLLHSDFEKASILAENTIKQAESKI